MNAAFKIVGKKQKVRNSIFDRKTISRQDLLTLTGLNERSIVRYTEELKRQKLIKETTDNTHRGRPSVMYHSNSEKIFFAGLYVDGRSCVFSAVNINGIPLAASRLVFNPGQSVSDIVSLILEQFTLFLEQLKEFILCSIGIAVVGGQQKRGFNSTLLLAAGKRYAVQTELHDSDELLLWFMADTHMLTGRIGGIFGKENFRLIVLENGETQKEYDGYLKKLRHFRIDPENAVKCYCGKYGCLDTVLCYSGMQKRYSFYSGAGHENISEILFVNNLYLKACGGDPHAERVVQEHGVMFGKIALKIAADLKLEQIIMMHTKMETMRFARDTYAGGAGRGATPFLFSNFTETETTFAPALLMRKRLLEYQKDKR